MNLMNEGVLPPSELDDRDERREESEAQDIKTTEDVIAWLRRPREGENAYLTAWRDEISDRLEAAHKRELSKNVSKNGADFGQLGNAAKLREAVKAVVDVGYPHNFQAEAPHIRGYCYDITRAMDKCFAALDTTSNQNTQKEN